MISLRLEKVSKAAAELLVLRSLTTSLTDCVGLIPSSTCMYVIDSRFYNEELILLGLTDFKNLALDDWRELFAENMLSVLGWPHEMEIDPVAGGSMCGFFAARFHTASSK